LRRYAESIIIKGVKSPERLLDESALFLHRVESDLPDDLPRIYVDKAQIQQLLINLTLNAVEATGAGGRIMFTTGYDPAADTIAIHVTDTGKGIEKQDLEKIFDPFFTTREIGTGLGLSIAHSIVEQHGGNIEVSSRSGSGTRFTVTLPVKGVSEE
jgi:signal transduction histidine kinase